MCADLVVKSNNLIEGFMNMTQNEYKFTLYLISKIKKDATDFTIQKVTVSEFAEILEYKGHKLYEYVKEFEDSLLSKKISIKYPNGDRLNINWFSYSKYINNTGTLEIAFNNHLAPFLLELDINFTKYFLKNIKNLGSCYAIRIYELLKQYEKLKERTIDLEELRQMLGITPSQYKLYGHLKDKVILKAQKELDSSDETDITFDFEEIKTGRKVTAVRFLIKSKNTDPTPDKENNLSQIVEEPQKDMNDIIIADIMKGFKSLYNADLHFNRTKEMIEAKGFEHVKQCLEDYHKYFNGRSLRNIGGDFYKFVMEEYTEPTNSNQIQHNYNFDQRKYKDEEYEQFYSNIEPKV